MDKLLREKRRRCWLIFLLSVAILVTTVVMFAVFECKFTYALFYARTIRFQNYNGIVLAKYVDTLEEGMPTVVLGRSENVEEFEPGNTPPRAKVKIGFGRASENIFNRLKVGDTLVKLKGSLLHQIHSKQGIAALYPVCQGDTFK